MVRYFYRLIVQQLITESPLFTTCRHLDRVVESVPRGNGFDFGNIVR
jgi:hypothetical protein